MKISRATAKRIGATIPSSGSYNPKIVIPFMQACGLPAPLVEFRFHQDRRWRFDFAWIGSRVALEVQGGIFTGGRHVRGAALVKEYEKLNAAAVNRWRVLFCLPRDLQRVEFMRTIAAALAGANLVADASKAAH